VDEECSIAVWNSYYVQETEVLTTVTMNILHY